MELHDEKKMRAFLLGLLDDAETERCDELSVVDDEFASALAVAENELVDDYARGALKTAERDAFERFYLATPRRRAKAAFASALRNHGPEAVVERVPFFRRFKLIWAVPAFAALAVAVTAAFWFARERGGAGDEARVAPTPSPTAAVAPTPMPTSVAAAPTASPANASPIPMPSPTPKATPAAEPSRPLVATIFLSPALRGAAAPASVAVSSGTAFLDARLRLEPVDYATFRASLVDESGREVWRSGTLRARGGVLALRIPARGLKPQAYTFVASGAAAGGEFEEFGSYTFRVVIR